VAGFAAAGIALVLRAVAPLSWQIVKPIACDLCMSWWGSLLVVAAWRIGALRGSSAYQYGVDFAITVLAAIPVSIATLKLIERLRASWEK
jgi:hypothetical protein